MKTFAPLASLAAIGFAALAIAVGPIRPASAQIQETKPGFGLAFTEASLPYKAPKLRAFTSSFKFAGGVNRYNRRIAMVLTFKPATVETTYHFELTDASGKFIEAENMLASVGSTYVRGEFTTSASGTYTMTVTEEYKPKVVFAKGVFTIGDGKAPAAPAGPVFNTGTLIVCEDTDDKLNPIGASGATWPADKRFNVLVKNPTPFRRFGLDLVIHKQNADGTDGEFVEEWGASIGKPEVHTKYATDGGLTALPAGTYTIYAIEIDKKQLTKTGNFTEYYAKTTLVVK